MSKRTRRERRALSKLASEVWHEEITGMVKGPPLYDEQQCWVRFETVKSLLEEHDRDKALMRRMAEALDGMLGKWPMTESMQMARAALAAYRKHEGK